MTHLLAFGIQVLDIIFFGLDLYGNALNELKAIPFQADNFSGVVGHDPYFS